LNKQEKMCITKMFPYLCFHMNTEMLHNTTEVKLINRKTSILFHLLFWMVYIGTITLFFGNILSLKVVFYRTLISAFFNAILRISSNFNSLCILVLYSSSKICKVEYIELIYTFAYFSIFNSATSIFMS